MALIVLSSNQAFNPGADLWVIPDFVNSKIANKLDWYNNFIFKKTLAHSRPEFSSEISQIIQETEIPTKAFQTKVEDNLMIATAKQLPNRWTVMVWYHNNPSDWCQKIFKLYQDLGKPDLRIFLPTNLGMNQFVESWRLVSSEEDFSIVVEN
ncbi:MAG: hypothetical protein KDD45_06705 [Bdellovibrionales bacterium]|nr:hypothetical protein [Bdellovibrionales bacterium]